MFITNQLTPVEMLSELVNLKGLSLEDTKRFRTLKHDKHLCPGFRERTATMLDAYKSHRTDVHDTQGFRDEGIDVHLVYNHEGEHHAGLQIKSFDEIEAWATKRDPSFMLRLKAQYAAALSNVGADYYYIMLCTDEIAHKKQIRSICSEFKQFREARIVLPRQALAFFELDDEWIATFVTQALCEHDAVLEAARAEATRMDPDHAYMQLALLCMACEGEKSVSQERLLEIYEEWLELSPGGSPIDERLPELIWALNGGGFTYGTEGEDSLALEDFSTSWCALYFDQKQRRGGDVQGRLAMLLSILPSSPQRRPKHRR